MVEPLRHRQTKGAATDMFYQLLRSLAAAGESATAIATLLKRKAAGVTSELTYSRSSWPVRRQGRSQSGNNNHLQCNRNIGFGARQFDGLGDTRFR